MQKKILAKVVFICVSWNMVMGYLDNVDIEYRLYNMKYKSDVYYNEKIDAYVIRITVYDEV